MAAIQYSLAMRGNPGDPDMPKRAYASIQSSGTLSLDDFCAHIAQHGSIWTPDIVSGVIKKMVLCMEELLCAGNTIELGSLGSFKVGVKSKGAKDFASFDVGTNIRKVPVNWVRGKVFKNLKDSQLGIAFERVLTRKDAEEAKKQKYGE